ncbi:protein FAR1-RELATED SEQUENCE 5-like [Carex rostrata]
MASEKNLDLNLRIDVASPHNIQQIGTSSKSPSNILNELFEYRLEDVNQLRFIDEEKFGVDNEISEACVRNNLEKENQQIGSESDVSVSPTNDDRDKCFNSPKETTLLDQETPKLGMEFDDVEAAYEFYNRYGAKKGFSIRNHKIKTAQGVVKFRIFCCSKEGFRGVDKRETNVVNHRPETRTGCQATMHIRLQKNGKFKITKPELEHNHTLASPGKTHMLRSQRKLGKAQKSSGL